jgi:hypothetical protein
MEPGRTRSFVAAAAMSGRIEFDRVLGGSTMLAIVVAELVGREMV